MTTSSPSRVLFFFSASGRAIGSSVYMCGDSVDSHAYELMIFNCHGLRTSEGSSQREEIQRLIGLPFVSIADLVADLAGELAVVPREMQPFEFRAEVRDLLRFQVLQDVHGRVARPCVKHGVAIVFVRVRQVQADEEFDRLLPGCVGHGIVPFPLDGHLDGCARVYQ